MGRRNNRAPRCSTCRVFVGLCLCGELPKLATRTRVVLAIHFREDRKSTNTGRLATACLTNAAIVLRGRPEEADAAFDGERKAELAAAVPPGFRPVMLFPHDDAVPLATFRDSPEPIALLVPDGTWGQASRMRGRLPGLDHAPSAYLPPGAPSRYRLRETPNEGAVSTLEAIARALEVLEEPAGAAIRASLEAVLATMVDRTLWVRGTIADEDVRGGIPEGAMRHDPRSGPGAATASTTPKA